MSTLTDKAAEQSALALAYKVRNSQEDLFLRRDGLTTGIEFYNQPSGVLPSVKVFTAALTDEQKGGCASMWGLDRAMVNCQVTEETCPVGLVSVSIAEALSVGITPIGPAGKKFPQRRTRCYAPLRSGFPLWRSNQIAARFSQSASCSESFN